MSVDVKPDRDAASGDDRLPARPRPAGADAARARLLEHIVAGGVAPLDAQPAAMVGRYRLVRRLGRGGMGEVWEAIADDDDARPVAIKILRPAVLAHEPTRKRFLREARTAASVRHEHIVRIFDVSSATAEAPFIVMELLGGEPLEAMVREHGALPWACAREILLQVADGLAFAHSRGVVHRDLKPANVMVRGSLEAPKCTIIDFGLARREIVTSGSESLSHTGEVFGSPPFMSPEQFRGDAADARSDVYSYGCLMFWVLTGRRPFEGEKIGDLMYKHLFQPAPAPSGMLCPARLEPALAAIVLRALRKAPEHRFATMDELLSALRRVEDDPRPVAVPHEDAIAVARPQASTRPVRRILPWLAIGAAAALGGVALSRSAPDAEADTPPASAPQVAAPIVGSPPAPTEAPRSRPRPEPAALAVTPERREDVTPATDRDEPPPPATRRRRRKVAHDEREPARTLDATPEPDPEHDVAASELPPNPFRSPPP